MSKEKLVPKLRFEEFENSNGWEKVELKDFLTKSVDNRGKTPPTTIEGDHPLIEVASIGKMTPDYSKVSKFMNEEIFKSKLRGYLKENDILFSTVGSIGIVSLMDDNKKAAIAQNIVGFRAKEGHVPEYVYSMLTSNYNQRRSNRIAMGAVQPSIKVSQLVNVKYPLSIIKEEQNKIGTFFKKIDEMIQVQQSKLNKVKDIKSAYLSEMFPKEGEKYPKKRFEGFIEPWTKYKLREFGKSTGGTSIESEFTEKGEYKVISIGSYSKSSKYIDQGLRTVKTKKTKKRILNKNDLTMILNDKTTSGDIIGRVLLIDDDNTYVYNQRTERIEVNKENFIPEFLYQYLNSNNARSKIIEASQGNTQIYVNWSTISELEYLIPNSLKEQEKIGQFFKNLDHQISIEEEKLTKLEKLKQAYLNDMFI